MRTQNLEVRSRKPEVRKPSDSRLAISNPVQSQLAISNSQLETVPVLLSRQHAISMDCNSRRSCRAWCGFASTPTSGGACPTFPPTAISRGAERRTTGGHHLPGGRCDMGNFVLRARAGTAAQPIVVRTAGTDAVAPGTRVTPGDAAGLAKLRSRTVRLRWRPNRWREAGGWNSLNFSPTVTVRATSLPWATARRRRSRLQPCCRR